MLRIHQASYRYPTADRPVVRGIDLHVAPGEFVLLTGPTGCGKSTLLRMAAGLLARHGSGEAGGTIEVGGRDPARMKPSERVALVGFVAQNPARQVVTGTLADEVAFALESTGATSDITARSAGLLAQVGLHGYPPDRSTAALSGGERQRLLVAAALSAGAGLLLLDEPLAHLDPAGARELVSGLRRLADSGTAVLIVEHRLEPLPASPRTGPFRWVDGRPT